ncbi:MULTISPECIES: hypothetical protein [unclassified Novosphingobium]|uniref:DUF1281 family ferredoxin-like fold protein n=1 Tax=unclassified Novosphingobium TaxID=2644732 RepID=UPI000D2F7119|nr:MULTISPECIES: hypothetical protein [unclassified Novosphingobium]PTR06393.1 hypothetical protein C8K11_1206 [Novosphingobium sp. GV055]PUA94812.1 hypothetical protein C8K12_1206 [Novosphingobium sp. GV061]PUB13737.1 hypothetical protein C8K14_1206 [Novosphingobium sp. GV079]PUB38435.1 hypothetical protein C8K10_1206 [Novosphingobium sp. GV027]
MPNHVTTTCAVSGPASDVQLFREMLFPDGDAEQFDFNKIIPMPAILKAAQESTIAEFGAALIMAEAQDQKNFFGGAEINIPDQWVAKMRQETGCHHMGEVARAYLAAHPEYREQGLLRLRAVAETGFVSWYPWAIQNWGTKWGSYRVSVTDNGEPFAFSFETAWSFPEPVFAKLVEKFPTLTFDLATFDEGWNFAGEGQMGAVVAKPFEIGSATNELYERVYGHAPELEDEGEA